jgi:molecular chaperone HtpG
MRPVTHGATEFHTAQVDLAGLIRVLGDNLYSTPSVVVRELVQNAHDSITRRRLEATGAAREADARAEARIVVYADPQAGTLRVDDTGAGLTDVEIVKYLATVGAGYTRLLRASTGDPDLIGAFGLGFLSAYVVAERVTVLTTSYQSPELGHRFQSRSGERYTIEEVEPRPIGTSVSLQLRPGFAGLADPVFLERVVARYCALLSVPIHLGLAGGEIGPRVNAPPPWRDPELEGAPAVRVRRARLDFAQRFERTFEPICTIEVGPAAAPKDATADARAGDDAPLFEEPPARGLLWIQDGLSYATSDNRNLSVYVRGMLVADDARKLLPRWAGFVGGVVESELLVPTASREDLVQDDAWSEAAELLDRSLVDGLARIAKREPETWRRILLRHNDALLGAAVADDRLFELLGDVLTLPTTEGDLTLAQLRARSPSALHVSLSAHGGYEEILFRALKVPIALGTRFAVLPFVRRWCERNGVKLVQLGTEAGNRAFFPTVDERELDDGARAWLSECLLEPGWKLVPTRFSPAVLPLVVIPDRDAELKARLESDEADKRISEAALGLARLFAAKLSGEVRAHLYVNLDAEPITRLLATRDDRGRRAGKMLRVLASLVTGPGSDAAPNMEEALAEYASAVCAILG